MIADFRAHTVDPQMQAEANPAAALERQSMVIAQLAGGLGNQLFQYAAARRLALRRGVPLLLDCSRIHQDHQRSYALAPFRIQAQIAPPELTERLQRMQYRSRFGRVANKLLSWLRQGEQPALLVERRFHFDPQVLDAPKDVYLVGYWQSEKYFADCADIIREDLRLKSEAVGENQRLAQQIGSVNSVSVHVRRADYVSDAQVQAVHGNCALDYYARSLEVLSRDEPELHLFVFSDEPAWCREHLRLPHRTTFVESNPPTAAHEDLRLMSLCKHHVIANSSFSWWGAWLAAHARQRVFAPRRWFRDPALDTRDLIPHAWTLVD